MRGGYRKGGSWEGIRLTRRLLASASQTTIAHPKPSSQDHSPSPIMNNSKRVDRGLASLLTLGRNSSPSGSSEYLWANICASVFSPEGFLSRVSTGRRPLSLSLSSCARALSSPARSPDILQIMIFASRLLLALVASSVSPLDPLPSSSEGEREASSSPSVGAGSTARPFPLSLLGGSPPSITLKIFGQSIHTE